MENFIVKQKLNYQELHRLADETFGDMVKAVADVETGDVAFSKSMHADAERMLLDNGSNQENLWGFNIYPSKESGYNLEFQSLINIRPRQSNRSMEIQDENIKNKIRKIVQELII